MMHPTITSTIDIRDRATDGPIPVFESTPTLLSPDRHEPIAPGDVLEHGDQLFIIVDVEPATPVGASTVTLFNQSTEDVRSLSVDDLLELDDTPLSGTTLHADVLIPADATMSGHKLEPTPIVANHEFPTDTPETTIIKS